MSIYKGTDLIAGAVVTANAANQDLSNLTSQGANIANWSSNVSNCITEIPQDIDLVLENNQLILKAGSKVYVPNGFEQDGTTPKFDEVVIENDVINTDISDNTVDIVFYSSGKHTLATWPNSICWYQDTEPTSGVYALWYNPQTNLMKYRTSSSGSWIDVQYSLPIGVAAGNGTVMTALDQVFNGFGYFDCVVFMLPGVKGLVPNGRNKDGSLHSIEFTIDKVKLAVRRTASTFAQCMTYKPSTDSFWFYNTYRYSEKTPPVAQYEYWYNPQTNIMKYCKGTSWEVDDVIAPLCMVGSSAGGTTKITSMYNIITPCQINQKAYEDTYFTSTSWYRIHPDGWIEQGGKITNNGLQTVTLLIQFSTLNYIILLTDYTTRTSATSQTRNAVVINGNKTRSSFQAYVPAESTVYAYWYACGY